VRPQRLWLSIPAGRVDPREARVGELIGEADEHEEQFTDTRQARVGEFCATRLLQYRMVSEHDREAMRRIGAAKAAAHAAALAEHLALPPIERLRRSFAMSAAMRTEANLAARVDDPSAFYARARALGLCDR